jgi:hypothetical protein
MAKPDSRIAALGGNETEVYDEGIGRVLSNRSKVRPPPGRQGVNLEPRPPQPLGPHLRLPNVPVDESDATQGRSYLPSSLTIARSLLSSVNS